MAERRSGATPRKAAATGRKAGSRRWLQNSLIVLAAGVLLIGAARGIDALYAVSVDQVIVAGSLQHTRKEEVQQVIAPLTADAFLEVDLAAIRDRLVTLPWVYSVTVRRIWPASLEVRVTEQLAIARWGSEGFLNHEGEVFHSDQLSGGTLPLLQGPSGSARHLMAYYLRMLELLEPAGLDVAQLALDDRGQLDIQLRQGFNLMVGNRDYIERVRRFVTVYNRELRQYGDRLQRVDLRYTDGLAAALGEDSHVAQR